MIRCCQFSVVTFSYLQLAEPTLIMKNFKISFSSIKNIFLPFSLSERVTPCQTEPKTPSAANKYRLCHGYVRVIVHHLGITGICKQYDRV